MSQTNQMVLVNSIVGLAAVPLTVVGRLVAAACSNQFNVAHLLVAILFYSFLLKYHNAEERT